MFRKTVVTKHRQFLLFASFEQTGYSVITVMHIYKCINVLARQGTPTSTCFLMGFGFDRVTRWISSGSRENSVPMAASFRIVDFLALIADYSQPWRLQVFWVVVYVVCSPSMCVTSVPNFSWEGSMWRGSVTYGTIASLLGRYPCSCTISGSYHITTRNQLRLLHWLS
jgi:hypothetical protein